MYDPQFDASFSMDKNDAVTNRRWWGGEPIWVTAEKSGRHSATLFWPGSEAAIEGIRPTYWLPYDEKMPISERVAQALAWLALPGATRPAFLTLYFEAVDTAGHDFGPQSKKLKEALTRVDEGLGLLLQGLRERGLFRSTNIVIVSDHGHGAGLQESSCIPGGLR